MSCDLVPVMRIKCIGMLFTFLNDFIEFFIISFINSCTTICIFGGTTIVKLFLIWLRFLWLTIWFRLQCKILYLRFGIYWYYNRRLLLLDMLIRWTIAKRNWIKFIMLLTLRLRRSWLDSSGCINLRINFINVCVVLCFDFFDF